MSLTNTENAISLSLWITVQYFKRSAKLIFPYSAISNDQNYPRIKATSKKLNHQEGKIIITGHLLLTQQASTTLLDYSLGEDDNDLIYTKYLNDDF